MHIDICTWHHHAQGDDDEDAHDNDEDDHDYNGYDNDSRDYDDKESKVEVDTSHDIVKVKIEHSDINDDNDTLLVLLILFIFINE